MNKDYYGLPTFALSNSHLALEWLAQAGPRLVRLFVQGSSDNWMAELPDAATETPYGSYNFRGGHRLWHAPEALPRTYIPDDTGMTVREAADGAVLTGAVEPGTSIRKSIAFYLQPDRPMVTLRHTLANEGLWPVELAPWALTMLALGGLAIFPQNLEPAEPARLLPNRQLVLWPYASVQDPRLVLADDYILIRAEPHLPPLKIGYMNPRGWIGYYRNGFLMVKRFIPQPEKPHVDFGCNSESYCNNQMIEMETLGPLTRLEPGQTIVHTEQWEFYPSQQPVETIEDVRALVQNLPLD